MWTTLTCSALVLFGACLCKSSSTFTVWQTQAQVVFGLTNPLNVLRKPFHVSLSYRGFAIHCTCVKCCLQIYIRKIKGYKSPNILWCSYTHTQRKQCMDYVQRVSNQTFNNKDSVKSIWPVFFLNISYRSCKGKMECVWKIRGRLGCTAGVLV